MGLLLPDSGQVLCVRCCHVLHGDRLNTANSRLCVWTTSDDPIYCMHFSLWPQQCTSCLFCAGLLGL